MLELIRTYTSLPNLHPALIHFPIAFLTVAVLLDTLSLILRRIIWLDRASVLTYLIGALGAGLAYLSGNQAEDSLGALPAATQALLSEHADWGLNTLLLFGILTLVRMSLAWIGRNRTIKYLFAFRSLVLAAAFFGQWVLFQTADRGGALVYQKGVAVAMPASTTNLPVNKTKETLKSANNGRESLVISNDGTISWRPQSNEVSALGKVLQPAPDTTGQAVGVITPKSSDDSGLSLEVSGRSLLLLPGSFGDLTLEAELDITQYKGIFGLAHHVKDASTYMVLELNNEGQLALAISGPDRRQILGQSFKNIPNRAIKIAVSATGSHYKGLIDDSVVVHGHRKSLPPGGAGIFMEGSGVIKLFALKLTPVREIEHD